MKVLNGLFTFSSNCTSRKILVFQFRPKILSANESWLFFNLQYLLIGLISDFDFSEVDRNQLQEQLKSLLFWNGYGRAFLQPIRSEYFLIFNIYWLDLYLTLIFWIQMDTRKKKSKFSNRICRVSWLCIFFS